MSVLLILESLIRTFGFGKIHLRQSDIDVGEPRTSAVFNVSPLSLSVMPSSDAHCSKIDSSLYGLLINGRMTSLFLQASQKKRDSGVDIRVADNGGHSAIGYDVNDFIKFSMSNNKPGIPR